MSSLLFNYDLNASRAAKFLKYHDIDPTNKLVQDLLFFMEDVYYETYLHIKANYILSPINIPQLKSPLINTK